MSIFQQIRTGGDDALSGFETADYSDFTAIDRADVYAVEASDFSGTGVRYEKHPIFAVSRLHDCGKWHE